MKIDANFILQIFGTALGIVGLIITLILTPSLSFIVILLLLLGTSLLILATHFISRLSDKIRETLFWNRVYDGGPKTPNRYKVETILVKLKTGDEIIVIARTCKRWLQENSIHNYLTAIEQGVHFCFVVQDLRTGVELMSENQIHELKSDQQDAIKIYKEIYNKVDKKDNFKLRYLKKPVTNSSVYITSKGKFKWLRQDIGMGFTEKAFVVIHEERLVKLKIENIHKMIDGETISLIEYTHEMALDEIKKIIEVNNHYLPIRQNQSNQLVEHTHKCFVEKNKKDVQENHNFPSPISIQLLLTNQCTTTCSMCSHSDLVKYERDKMNDVQILRTLEWIEDLGVKSLILSGGEPLNHPDIERILDKAFSLGLHIGLLTSGILSKSNGESVSGNLAKLVSKCKWVQVSIDAFTPETYKKIRNRNLQLCIETIENLMKNGLFNIQICYTIQKENIKEIIDKTWSNYLSNIPKNINIRFKFAHGFNRDFLLSEDSLKKAINHIGTLDYSNVEGHYLESMIKEGWFSYSDISLGLPVKSKMNEFKNNNYNCHILDLSLFINSNADVYPCCYLFDDNVGLSKYRDSYIIGNLKDPKTQMVPNKEQGNINPLKEIWEKSSKLSSFRKATLPIEHDACSKCTRHIHQNDIMNQLWKIFEKYKEERISLGKFIAMHEEYSQPQNGFWV